jgi:ATP-binding cassette, subfamily C (CFTR/MRP), member 1
MSSADHIILLGNDGRIAKQGSFESLSSSFAYVQSLVSEEKKEKTETSTQSALVNPTAQVLIDRPAPPFTERRKGSLQTYVYLARMVGWINAVVFVGLGAGFVFGLSFPRE